MVQFLPVFHYCWLVPISKGVVLTASLLRRGTDVGAHTAFAAWRERLTAGGVHLDKWP